MSSQFQDLDKVITVLGILDEVIDVDLQETIGLLKALSEDDGTMVIYPCGVHETELECSVSYLSAALAWADEQTAFIDPDTAALAYIKEYGANESCHS